MAEDNNLLRERAKILQDIQKIQAEQGREAAKLDDEYIKLKGRLEEILDTIKKSRDEQRKSVGDIVSLTNESQSLSSVYSNIKIELQKQATLQTSIVDSIGQQLSSEDNISTKNIEQSKVVDGILSKYREQASLATKLSQLTDEDSVKKKVIINQMGDIQSQIDNEIESLDKQNDVAKEFLGVYGKIEESIKRQKEEGKRLSANSLEQKAILEKQAEFLDSIKTKISAFGASLEQFIKSPMTALAALTLSFGKIFTKIGEINQQLGTTGGILNSTVRSTALMSVFFDDALGTTQELANQFGSMESASLRTQFNTNLLAKNLGISGKETAQLVGSFARLNNGSTSVANDLIVSTREFAKQRGVIPSQVMADLASNTEAFAMFGKDGGKNIAQAAVFARQLGVEMSTLTGIADNLLDFESSITKELELSAMLGRNINLNKARELAFAGDIQGATDETLRALGGIDAFNQMDVFQKRSAAQLLGVSVDQLQKMAENQGKVNTEVSFMEKSFNTINESVLTFSNNWFGQTLKGLSAGLAVIGQMGVGLKTLNELQLVQFIRQKASAGWAKIKSFFTAKEVALAKTQLAISQKQLATEKARSIVSSTTPSPDKIPKGAGLGGINPMTLLKGAAAMLVISGALFVFGKALQEFADVEWSQVGMAVVGLFSLVGAVTLLGLAMTKASSFILTGAGVMLIVAASLFVLGKAIQAIGTGFEMLSSGISTLVPTILSVGTVIGGLITYIAPIGLMSVALFGLASSLAAVSTAGLLALPALAAIGAVGAIAVGVTSLFNKEDEGTSVMESRDTSLLNEIKGLRDDLRNGKVAVYMDGKKVTAEIGRVVSNTSTNAYGA